MYVNRLSAKEAFEYSKDYAERVKLDNLHKVVSRIKNFAEIGKYNTTIQHALHDVDLSNEQIVAFIVDTLKNDGFDVNYNAEFRYLTISWENSNGTTEVNQQSESSTGSTDAGNAVSDQQPGSNS